ncbi:MAG TPA: hypothetical protein ENJ95_12635 [Bacteroidetes bacterium]|nr:hypothetical protein [Bacteroidota bacterium]
MKIVHDGKKEYLASEMAQLYQDLPNEWLLLEILKTNEQGRAEKLKLLKHAKDKDELYDYLMDETEDWSFDNNYIFVYSDPEKECEL